MAKDKTRLVLIVGGIAAAALVAIAGFRTGEPDRQDIQFIQNGRASWYGPRFQGQKTASGVKFNQSAPTAAHKTLPLGSEVTVTNLDTGKSVNVEINDRGPYITYNGTQSRPVQGGGTSTRHHRQRYGAGADRGDG